MVAGLILGRIDDPQPELRRAEPVRDAVEAGAAIALNAAHGRGRKSPGTRAIAEEAIRDDPPARPGCPVNEADRAPHGMTPRAAHGVSREPPGRIDLLAQPLFTGTPIQGGAACTCYVRRSWPG